MTSRQSPKIAGKQRGVALVISLIILAVITTLSVSAMRSTTMETKIAVNQQFKQLSFQAAESAFARLLGENPNVDLPGTVGDFEPNEDYYERDATDSTSTQQAQPGTDADLRVELVKVSAPGEYKFSGFGLDIITVIYQADAFGHVTGNEATTNNRMEVALVRE
ncbi:MAG: hypothetical protein GY814_08755 [Gammaproteobacteria bacterium]|nr:hypothetical protein [Gammaproteobacteria bacterium]